jgi:hypothetical protein
MFSGMGVGTRLLLLLAAAPILRIADGVALGDLDQAETDGQLVHELTSVEHEVSQKRAELQSLMQLKGLGQAGQGQDISSVNSSSGGMVAATRVAEQRLTANRTETNNTIGMLSAAAKALHNATLKEGQLDSLGALPGATVLPKAALSTVEVTAQEHNSTSFASVVQAALSEPALLGKVYMAASLTTTAAQHKALEQNKTELHRSNSTHSNVVESNNRAESVPSDEAGKLDQFVKTFCPSDRFGIRSGCKSDCHCGLLDNCREHQMKASSGGGSLDVGKCELKNVVFVVATLPFATTLICLLLCLATKDLPIHTGSRRGEVARTTSGNDDRWLFPGKRVWSLCGRRAPQSPHYQRQHPLLREAGQSGPGQFATLRPGGDSSLMVR